VKLNLIILLALIIPPREKQASINQEEKTVVCFVYHRFGDKRYPSTDVPISDFENHLRYLKKNQFQVLTLSNALNYLKSNEPVQKTAVITIDDGYKSFFENGWPLLKKYKMPATLFINTKTVGAADFMSWEQLKNLKDGGVEIGNHTHSHDFFLNQSESIRYETFEKEIKESQQIIKEHLDFTPRAFTFPYGEFDERMKMIVKDLGFEYAAAQNSGVLYQGSDLFQIPRFPMSDAYSDIKQFSEKTRMMPLKVIRQSPQETITSEAKPEFEIEFRKDDLRLADLRCFVQGGECEFKIDEGTDDKVSIKMQSKKSILSRRRTLYTITVPDKKGRWHWFSKLWINPNVKE